MRSSSVTAWAIIGSVSMRLTLYSDGVFRTLTGFVPEFDPLTSSYVTDAAVGNAAARSGTLRITGHSCSSAALRNALVGSWRSELTLTDLLAHPFLSKTAPSIDVIEAAYAVAEEIAA